MSSVLVKWSSEEQEIDRVLGYLKKLEFYKKNNYPLSLPKCLDDHSSNVDIKTQVLLEYNPDQYLEDVDTVIHRWRKIEETFFKNTEKILKVKPLPIYKCLISQYGTGGSYYPPDCIILNIKSKFFGFHTIGHEVIHLLIHDYIDKYRIGHWQKERLVDHYFSRILGIDKFQKIPDDVDVSGVDAICEEFSSQGAKELIRRLYTANLNK